MDAISKSAPIFPKIKNDLSQISWQSNNKCDLDFDHKKLSTDGHSDLDSGGDSESIGISHLGSISSP